MLDKQKILYKKRGFWLSFISVFFILGYLNNLNTLIVTNHLLKPVLNRYFLERALYPSWYQFYQLPVFLIGILMSVGFWYLKKWSIYLYLSILISTNLLMRLFIQQIQAGSKVLLVMDLLTWLIFYFLIKKRWKYFS